MRVRRRQASAMFWAATWSAFFIFLFPVSAGAEITFEWATVGHAGNGPDPFTGARFGNVSYAYRIATTEVSNAQYVAFLNAVDPAGGNPNAVYHSNMGVNPRGGIAFDPGAASGDKYAPRPHMADKPVNFISFFDCMRFVNWLHNGQGAGGTESGVYAISDGLSETRAPGARFFLPTENEWYKAAYFDPTPGAGGGDQYWLYPTRGNAIPVSAIATALGDIANPGPNVANYDSGADWNGVDGNLTTVGSAGPLSPSFFGTFDQGGNVSEWNETLITGSARGARGGAYSSTFSSLQSASASGRFPALDGPADGFRVASPVPEPDALALLAFGGGMLAAWRRR